MKTTTTNTKTSSATTKLNKILSGLGKLTRSCNDVRHCSRCNLPLTDAASWERGIGPICAKKDTHLFAKTIPANFTMATMHAITVETSALPLATQEVWSALRDVLFEKAQSAINAANVGAFTFSLSGEDCRLVAKVIDWMLSFPMVTTVKHQLIQIVKFLGFVGLAGVLSGMSSTGEAELKFDESLGKLFLTGSSNKAGFGVMRLIPGIVVPRKRGGGAYEAPATQHESFIAAVMEFWPCFNGEVDKIVEQCKAWIAANPVKASVQQKRGLPEAQMVNRTVSGDFTITFKWLTAVSPRIVDEIKALPLKDRRYDPASKTWAIQFSHYDAVKALLDPHYDVVQTESNVAPAPVAKYPNIARRSWYGSRARF